MAGLELLGTPAAFRSNLLNLNTPPQRSRSVSAPQPKALENKARTIDFESMLRESMPPLDGVSEMKLAQPFVAPAAAEVRRMQETAVERKVSLAHDDSSHREESALPLNRHVSLEMARNSYDVAQKSHG